MAQFLTDSEWQTLLAHIHQGRCVPVLGAGAAADVIPVGRRMANELAEEHKYPFENNHKLQFVSEFLAVKYGRNFPKETVLKKWFSDIQYPDLSAPNEPHSVLADLPLPLYITTNYDDLMVRALRLRHKDPRREIAPWSPACRDWQRQQFEAQRLDPAHFTPEKPVVFHMHGCDELPESLILSDSDYIDFLAYFSNRLDELFPDYILKALSNAVMLIIGYSLQDFNFRLVLRSFVENSHDVTHITVQYPPPKDDDKRRYIEEYFSESLNLKVVWARAQDFAAELHCRFTASG